MIVALFYLAHLIEARTNTLDLSQMGGIKLKAPNLAILLLIVTLGSIALPLTSGFVGEFLILTGLFKQSVWFAFFGGTAMILSAIYMLNAYQRIMLGNLKAGFEKMTDIRFPDYLILIPLIIVILVLGIYPHPVLSLLKDSVTTMQSLMVPVTDLVFQK
jgi:NADH-quinone oxidoreductase subunit M